MFAILKFTYEKDKNDETEINYEIGLTKWLIDIDEQMKGYTYWPPSDQDAGNFVRKEKPVDQSWQKYSIEVLRYYDLYIKARAGIREFMAEGSAYETEKETGRGKRKRRRNRLFDESSSDEELTKRNKKLIPPPPSVPFKKDSKKAKYMPNLSMTSNPSSETCSKSNVDRLKRTQNTNKNTDNAKKVQSIPLEDTKFNGEFVMRTKKSIPVPPSIFEHKQLLPNSEEDIQEAEQEANKCLSTSFPPSKIYSKSNIIEKLKRTQEIHNNASVNHTKLSTYESNGRNKKSSCNKKVQSPIKETLVEAESTSPLNSISTPQSRRFSPIKSGFYQRMLSTSTANNSSEKSDEEVNEKIDIIILNQGRLNRSLLSNETRLQKPINFPALPVSTEDDLYSLETFLEDDNNFAASCDYLSSFITSKDIAKSTVKIAVKLLTNSMASTMSFKGQNKKKPFSKLKIWEVIQGSLLIKFEDSALFEAEKTIKTWLANAPWRKQDNCYDKRNKK